MSTTQRILARLADPVYVRNAVASARKLTGGPNACAATLTTVLKDLGLVDEISTWTSHIVGEERRLSPLEQRYPMRRILHPAEMLPGDICASRDRPRDGNTAPDHVFILVSAPEGPDRGNQFARVIDNYCRGGKAYWRNLGKSGRHAGVKCEYTPVAYALRFVVQRAVSGEVAHARQRVVDALAPVYKAAKGAELPDEVMHCLNAFRWSAELRELKPGGD